MSITELVVLVIVVAAGALVLVGWLQTQALIEYLGQHHTEVYESLGRPKLLVNNSRLIAFIWSEEPRRIADERLIRRVTRLKWMHTAYATLFAAILILFFFAMLAGRHRA